jgi:hypothetical protein
MKHKIAITGAAALATGLLTACGGYDNAAAGYNSGTPAVTSRAVDTSLVLVEARRTSEVSVPFTVNDGALVFTDTSETAEPLSITGP